jgi:hypothetical protein
MRIPTAIQFVKLFFLALPLVAPLVSGATVIVHEDEIEVTGQIAPGEAKLFISSLASKTSSVFRVKFRECFGGSLTDGFSIAYAIRNANLDVQGSGAVASACAIAFMGGRNRSVASESADFSWQLHRPRKISRFEHELPSQAASSIGSKAPGTDQQDQREQGKTRDVPPSVLISLEKMLIKYSDGLLNKEFIDKAFSTAEGAGLVANHTYGKSGGEVYFCLTPRFSRLKCELIPGADASSIGVLSPNGVRPKIQEDSQKLPSRQ